MSGGHDQKHWHIAQLAFSPDDQVGRAPTSSFKFATEQYAEDILISTTRSMLTGENQLDQDERAALSEALNVWSANPKGTLGFKLDDGRGLYYRVYDCLGYCDAKGRKIIGWLTGEARKNPS